jgi:hypothetical protein
MDPVAFTHTLAVHTKPEPVSAFGNKPNTHALADELHRKLDAVKGSGDNIKLAPNILNEHNKLPGGENLADKDHLTQDEAKKLLDTMDSHNKQGWTDIWNQERGKADSKTGNFDEGSRLAAAKRATGHVFDKYTTLGAGKLADMTGIESLRYNNRAVGAGAVMLTGGMLYGANQYRTSH